MAQKKTKLDKLDDIITKEGLEEGYNWYSWWLYDDDDDWQPHDKWCDCHICFPYDYDYLPEELQPRLITHISKRGKIITEYHYRSGKLIDMSSIYPKEVIRQKRINHILGIENLVEQKTTILDFLRLNK